MCKNMTDALIEDVVEITWVFDRLRGKGIIGDFDGIVGGSDTVKQEIRKIAEQFEEKFPYETTWEDGELDYIEEIEKFAEEKLIEAFGIEEEAEEVQKVICINERNAISRQPQIIAGKEYYLDLSSVNGDFEGDWYGEIYSDKNKSEYIGHLKLNHFRSSI